MIDTKSWTPIEKQIYEKLEEEEKQSQSEVEFLDWKLSCSYSETFWKTDCPEEYEQHVESVRCMLTFTPEMQKNVCLEKRESDHVAIAVKGRYDVVLDFLRFNSVENAGEYLKLLYEKRISQKKLEAKKDERLSFQNSPVRKESISHAITSDS